MRRVNRKKRKKHITKVKFKIGHRRHSCEEVVYPCRLTVKKMSIIVGQYHTTDTFVWTMKLREIKKKLIE